MPWFGSLRRRGGIELVGECEAFLAGRLAERIEQRAESVPVWAWTNLLAHGSRQDLCSERRRFRVIGGQWREGRSFLVAELLDLADEFGPLTEIQRTVLVPLELELASCTEVADWEPFQWVASVDVVLGRYRQAYRRRSMNR